jgi:[acyl-carrier-protein] S-malonyltransferase
MPAAAGNRIAFVFPGQGSQSLGMLGDLAVKDKIVQDTYGEASEALGYDLWALTQNGPESRLNATEVTQPALLTAGVAVWRLWQRAGGPSPSYMAGHSLGEYTALVCAGAMQFQDAVVLVRDRGRYMQEVVPEGTGAMAAILGLDADSVARVCAEAAGEDIVSAANFNSPEQTVIAGHTQAVNRAMELARQAGAKRAIPLPVSVPSHCRLMEAAAARLADRLEQTALRDCVIPVIQNVDAGLRHQAAGIKAGLVRQLHLPVRWVETIRRLKALECGTIVESGPGKVLTGLIKRIDREIKTLSIGDVGAFEQAVRDMHT